MFTDVLHEIRFLWREEFTYVRLIIATNTDAILLTSYQEFLMNIKEDIQFEREIME